MAVTNQWELFGLDLSRVIDKLKLGASQLLWGEEAGLRQKFYPKPVSLNPSKEVHDRYAKLVPVSEQPMPQQPKALLFPSDLMLTKQIEMPIAAERIWIRRCSLRLRVTPLYVRGDLRRLASGCARRRILETHLRDSSAHCGAGFDR